MSRMRLLGAVMAGGLLLGAAPALAANPYPPPSKGTGTVTPSHIKVGECAVFSGDGFAPAATVAVTDNGASSGSAVTDVNGQFSKQLCYTSDAKKGRHDLAGTGRGSQGDTLEVTAVLIVEGARQSASNPTTAQGGAPAGRSSGPSSPSTAVVAGETSGAVQEPPAEPQAGGLAPVDSSSSGLRLLALGAGGLAFAILASLLLLLISRRRRRDEAEGGAWPQDAAPALG